MSDDYSGWASRRTGRPAAQETPTVAPAPAPVAPAAQALPPPAPGYQWAWSPTHNAYIQVQVAAPPPAPPVRQPGTTPYVSQPHTAPAPGQPLPPPGAPPYKPVQTCTLVKPGNRDNYAEMLAGLPDLAPDRGYDAMAGRQDPVVTAELSGAAGLIGAEPPVAHHPSRPPVTSAPPLKSSGG